MASASTPTEPVNPGVGEACALFSPPSRQLPDGHMARGTRICNVMQTFAGLAGQAIELARLSARRTYHQARNGALNNYSRGTRRAQDLATRTWNSAGDLKREHPVRVLAILAGTAFVAGVASRVWRSRSL